MQSYRRGRLPKIKTPAYPIVRTGQRGKSKEGFLARRWERRPREAADDGLGMTADPDEHKAPGPRNDGGRPGLQRTDRHVQIAYRHPEKQTTMPTGRRSCTSAKASGLPTKPVDRT